MWFKLQSVHGSGRRTVIKDPESYASVVKKGTKFLLSLFPVYYTGPKYAMSQTATDLQDICEEAINDFLCCAHLLEQVGIVVTSFLHPRPYGVRVIVQWFKDDEQLNQTFLRLKEEDPLSTILLEEFMACEKRKINRLNELLVENGQSFSPSLN